MSGFFSLAKDQEQDHHHHHPTSNGNLFLFKNEEIYSKGFELWQQYYHLHQQRLQAAQGNQSSSLHDRRSYIHHGNNNNIITAVDKSGVNEGMNCQDCGNQAKKDCDHLRCRTCCKSRGYQCRTHVKSTWVPAAKRRERQQQMAEMESAKRLRDNTAMACTAGFEVGTFPPEVNSPAVFRCVRVSTADDAEELLAYQTAVTIGGHVFKGILYDQGPESRHIGIGGRGESSSGGIQHHRDLIATTAAAATGGNPSQLLLPADSSIYPAPLNAFIAGTQFFPPPRS